MSFGSYVSCREWQLGPGLKLSIFCHPNFFSTAVASFYNSWGRRYCGSSWIITDYFVVRTDHAQEWLLSLFQISSMTVYIQREPNYVLGRVFHDRRRRHNLTKDQGSWAQYMNICLVHVIYTLACLAITNSNWLTFVQSIALSFPFCKGDLE